MEYLTIKEAAKYIGITVGVFRCRVEKGIIPSHKTQQVGTHFQVEFLWLESDIKKSKDAALNYKRGSIVTQSERDRESRKTKKVPEIQDGKCSLFNKFLGASSRAIGG